AAPRLRAARGRPHPGGGGLVPHPSDRPRAGRRGAAGLAADRADPAGGPAAAGGSPPLVPGVRDPHPARAPALSRPGAGAGPMTAAPALTLLALLLAAPALPGIATRTKSWLTGRRGPPVLQLYFD